MQRMTRQRAALAELLDATPDFRSAQQLHQMLAESGRPVGLATVYRTLQAMAEAGDVDVLRIEDGEALYRRCAHGHHHHLVCRECGTAVELTGDVVERWATRIAQEHDFVEVEHTAELVGTCRDCAARRYRGR
ncbi:MAG TPA: Fur family transcriptional regulator [Actinotalea caeni]|uniref:Fur family transcriptional regulator n=1 Tax=Actinotalea caeni TaxID=1348467 RepID=UPI0012E31DD2|nr:Fur family transcriptional regulator [Actinotalea caeni]HLV56433.1 Fur family transcriptional regulator [Actinotalea caeni]